jgi:hypothetical protein
MQVPFFYNHFQLVLEKESADQADVESNLSNQLKKVEGHMRQT